MATTRNTQAQAAQTVETVNLTENTQQQDRSIRLEELCNLRRFSKIFKVSKSQWATKIIKDSQGKRTGNTKLCLNVEGSFPNGTPATFCLLCSSALEEAEVNTWDKSELAETRVQKAYAIGEDGREFTYMMLTAPSSAEFEDVEDADLNFD